MSMRVGDRRRRHEQLADAVRGDEFVGAACFDDEHVAVFARDVEMTVGSDRRRAVGAASRAEPHFVQRCPRLQVVR